MERLTKFQIRILRERHPDANRTSFLDRVSKVTIGRNLSDEKMNFLKEMNKFDLEVEVVRFTND